MQAIPRSMTVFVVCLLVYTLNLRGIPSGDTLPTALVPLTILLDGTPALDRFAPLLGQLWEGQPYFLTSSGEHTWSSYPVAGALIVLPLYLPLVLVPGLAMRSPEELLQLALQLEQVAAAVVAALTVTVFFRLLRRIVGEADALGLALLFAFGTEIWSTSSQALWQHGPATLMLVLSMGQLARGGLGLSRRAAERMGVEHRDVHAPVSLSLCGLFGALAVATRPADLPWLGAVGTWLLLQRTSWRGWLAWLGPIAVVGGLVAVYNLETSGALLGAYYAGKGTGPDFGSAAAGLLVSPGRGLFVYTPFLLVAVLGAVHWLRRGGTWKPWIAFPSLVFVLGSIALNATWYSWWGGWCYGPRLLTDALPALFVLMLPVLPAVESRWWSRTLLLLACAAAVTVQAIGAFCYPRGAWDETPVDVDVAPDRLWDWDDDPIRRAAYAGPDLSGWDQTRE